MIPNEYRQIYFCEFSHSKTYPSLSLIAAERKDAAVGAFMIRKNKKTGKETKSSCMLSMHEKVWTWEVLWYESWERVYVLYTLKIKS